MSIEEMILARISSAMVHIRTAEDLGAEDYNMEYWKGYKQSLEHLLEDIEE
jgi:hypothetical protein